MEIIIPLIVTPIWLIMMLLWPTLSSMDCIASVSILPASSLFVWLPILMARVWLPILISVDWFPWPSVVLWLPCLTSMVWLPCSTVMVSLLVTVWVSSCLMTVVRSLSTSRDSSFFTRVLRSFSACTLTSSLPFLSSNDIMLKLSAPPFGELRDLTPLTVLLSGSAQGGIMSALYTLPTTIG